MPPSLEPLRAKGSIYSELISVAYSPLVIWSPVCPNKVRPGIHIKDATLCWFNDLLPRTRRIRKGVFRQGPQISSSDQTIQSRRVLSFVRTVMVQQFAQREKVLSQ